MCPLEVLNLHQVLEEEWRHNHGLETQLHREQDNLPTAYHRHPTQVRRRRTSFAYSVIRRRSSVWKPIERDGLLGRKPSFRGKALSRRVAETLSLPLRLSRVVRSIPNICVIELVLSRRKCGEVAVGET